MAVLPLVVLVCALLWQAVVAGQAVWLSGAAARAAARAEAVGGDPLRAARGALPARLRRDLRVRAGDDGPRVRVVVGVPAVLGGGTLTTVSARAGFPEQAS
ncbi:MAG: pilus assembly protein [Solirubrobacteraceae bacterium]